MRKQKSIKSRIHNIIFTTNGYYAKLFDIWLLVFILLSCFLVIIESVPEVKSKWGAYLLTLEWAFTIIFTIEYVLRIYSAKNPLKYITSAWGIIDLLAIIPTYLMFIYNPIHSLLGIRSLRLIRVFRVYKLSRYLRGETTMIVALKSSRPKIIVFLLLVILLSVVLGTIMYIVEGSTNPGFNTIPESIYWSIVTLTTVGYGDVVPLTIVGKIISSFIMILGYGIIAVPTGIVSSEITKARSN